MIFDPLKDMLRRTFQAKPQPQAGETAPNQKELGWAYETLIYRPNDFTHYNPDSLLTYKGRDVYKRMMRDEQVKAASRFKRNAVVSRGWYFDVGADEETKEPNKQHEEMKDYFTAMLKNLQGSVKDLFNNVLTALQNGFSVCEKVAEPFEWNDKPYWGYRVIRLLPFYTFNEGFVIDEYGNIDRLEQLIGSQQIEIPLDKVIYFVHQPDMDMIYGESDLRSCYRAWWSKDIVIKFMNIHLERHAGGMFWAEVEPEGGNVLTDPAKRQALENSLKNVTASTAMIMPSGVKLQMHSPANTDSYEKAIAVYDKAIAKSMLVPNLLGMSEQGDTGSYSQSQTQLEAFFWVMDDLAERLADALNEQLFREQALWNFGTDDFPPFRFEPMSDYQKMEIAKIWGELVSKGAVTKTDTDEAHTRKMLDYPEKGEEEEPKPVPGLPPEGEDVIPAQPGMEPGNGGPPEEDDIPEAIDEEQRKERNNAWLSSLPEHKKHEARVEMQERPWLKRVDFQKLEKQLDKEDDEFSDGLHDLMAKGRISVENQIVKTANGRSFGYVSPKEVDGDNAVRLPRSVKAGLGKVSRKSLKRTLDEHYELARKELPKKRMQQNPIAPGMDKTKAESFLASRAMTIQGVVDRDVLEEVKALLMNAIKYDWSLRETMEKMRDNTRLMALLPDYDAAGRPVNKVARLENIARTNTAEAMNAARNALFTSKEMRGFVQAFEYSAILDARTTEICSSLHGRVRKDWGEYAPPNHFQCRSILVPVTAIDDWDGKQSKVPAAVEPQEGFG